MLEVSLLITSFVAGILTILAPCAIPILPVIVGTSSIEKNRLKPLIIIGSLGISILVFSLLLKASTIFLDVPSEVWKIISGAILVLLGTILIFPAIWEKITLKTGFSNASSIALGNSSKKEGYLGDILVGAALGPVFSSCSPTYAIILATILPINFFEGLIYLIVYVLGLMVVMLGITFAGRKLIVKLGWATNPNGLFKKIVGAILIAVGLAVIFGLDKKLETYLVESGLYDSITSFEIDLAK